VTRAPLGARTMSRNIHCPAVALVLVLGGCAGAEMSRFGDENDGGLASGDTSSDSGAAETPTTLATTATTDDGADGDPSTSDTPSDASTGAHDDSSTSAGEESPEGSSGDDVATSLAESSSGASSSEGGELSSSSGDGETAPIDDVDLSGYTIVQTGSDRELVLPDDTAVPLGGCLVVGRNASPGAFQAFWDMNWGDEVVYIDGADDFPSINGDETYSLRSAADVLLEGPTPALEMGTAVWRSDADDVDGWNVDMSPNTGSTPGISDAFGGSSGTPYLSEYSDPTGAGNFVYEFVEICIAP
jgi:hypothetical protein